jgi:hypothetical protein
VKTAAKALFRTPTSAKISLDIKPILSKFYFAMENDLNQGTVRQVLYFASLSH